MKNLFILSLFALFLFSGCEKKEKSPESEAREIAYNFLNSEEKAVVVHWTEAPVDDDGTTYTVTFDTVNENETITVYVDKATMDPYAGTL